MSDVILNVSLLDFQWESSDPFLFCAFHKDAFPSGNENLSPDASLSGRNIGQDFVLKEGWRMYHGDKIPGFPSHPHRGFETITLVPEGLVDHADSLGAAGRYGDGDAQWLTTGKGVQHSEMFPMLNQESANPLLLFQIWLNLPAASKMAEPHFKMFWHEDIPVYKTVDAQNSTIKVTVIAGSLEGVTALNPPPDSWAANPDSHVAIWLIELAPATQWILPGAVKGLNRKLYFYEGETVECDDQKITVSHGLSLKSERPLSLKNGNKTAKLLLLQGKPINEPVAQYGPFVMNNRAELQKAFTDYQSTQFGGWPWPRTDPVHDRRGRFALYGNGTEELPKEIDISLSHLSTGAVKGV